MKSEINTLANLRFTSGQYPNLEKSISDNELLIKQHFEKYSKNKPYDLVEELVKENDELIAKFQKLVSSDVLICADIMSYLDKHNDRLMDTTNLSDVAREFGVGSEFTNKFIATTKFLDFSFKPKSNSNYLVFYDLNNKDFLWQRKDNYEFPIKSYSYFVFPNICYVSGGIENGCPTANFIKLTAVYNGVDFDVSLEKLRQMNHARRSHAFISFKNYFIAIGGANTKTVEIYDEKSGWADLQELPFICPNPSCFVLDNKYVYVLTGSLDMYSRNVALKTSLVNLGGFLSGEQTYKDVLF